MSKIIDTIQLFLNSKTADTYINNYTSDCIFKLPHIQLPKKNKYKISVQNASIPYSFFNCDYYNNQLIYSVNVGIDITITIPQGNYNTTSLRTYLLSVMTGFSISYIAYNNSYVFTHSTHDFTFKSNSTCFELLGLTDNINHNSTTRVLTSDISINFFTIRNIYIQSNNIITNNINSNTPNNSNILCSIPVLSSSYSIINYSNVNDIKMIIDRINNFTLLHISITDQDGDILDLNGCHFSLTLQIDIVE